MPTRIPVVAGLVLLTLAACNRPPGLETRTFEIHYLSPGEVENLIAPYVFNETARLSIGSETVSVRETPANLKQIERVLLQYDRPKPGVRLHFQIIRADGSGESDPAIAEVEGALRALFRFRGYELVAEAVIAGVEGSQARQAVVDRASGKEYGIRANILDVRALGDSGTVRVMVDLFMEDVGTALQTGVNLRAGQTAVLGNVQPDPRSPTIILTVRPEFVHG